MGESTRFKIKIQGDNFLNNDGETRGTRPTVKKIYLPCRCRRSYKTVIVLTNKLMQQARITLDDDDLLVPYTSKIRKKLKRVWRNKCQKPENLITIDLVDELFQFLKLKIVQQRRAQDSF